MKTTPVISVVIPVYSGGQFLGPAIDSVLTQTFQDFEILLVDNNAPEETAEVVRAYAEKYPDKIRALKETQKGVSAARNKGILEARGDFIALLDDDDLMLPERLERQLAVVMKKPDISLIFCGHRNIDWKNGKILEKDIFGAQGRWKVFEESIKQLLSAALPDRNLDSFHFAFPSMMFFRKEKALRAGLFHNDLYREQDSHFCLKMFFEGDFEMVDDVLVHFREKRNEDNVFRNADFVKRHIAEKLLLYRIVCEFFLEKDASLKPILEGDFAAYELDNIACNLIRFAKTAQDKKLIQNLYFQAWKKSGFKPSRLKSFIKSLFPLNYWPRFFWFDAFLPERIDPSISWKRIRMGFSQFHAPYALRSIRKVRLASVGNE